MVYYNPYQCVWQPKLTECVAGFEALNEDGDEGSDDNEDDEEEDGDDDEGDYYGDGDMTRAMEESRQAYYGHDQAAGSSRAASAYAPAYAPGKLCSLVNLQLRTNSYQLRLMIIHRHRELWILRQLPFRIQWQISIL